MADLAARVASDLAQLAEHAGRANHVADAAALTRAAETVAACPFVAHAQGIVVGLALAKPKRRKPV